MAEAFIIDINIPDFFRNYIINNTWDITELTDYIKNNGDVNIRLPRWGTFLCAACQDLNADVIQLLLENGANPNPIDSNDRGFLSTPLINVCKYHISSDDVIEKQIYIVKMLVHFGANINVDIWYWNPLRYVILNLNLKLADALLDYGANTNIKFLSSEDTILHCIICKETMIINYIGETEFYNLVKKIIILCDDLEYDVYQDMTYLLHAVRYHAKISLKLLIDHGANINVYSKIYREPPLMVAYDSGFYDIVEILINAGCNINDTSISQRPLLSHYIINLPSTIFVVKHIISHNADVNQLDSDGYSPLDYAKLYHDVDIINDLVAAGAKSAKLI